MMIAGGSDHSSSASAIAPKWPVSLLTSSSLIPVMSEDTTPPILPPIISSKPEPPCPPWPRPRACAMAASRMPAPPVPPPTLTLALAARCGGPSGEVRIVACYPLDFAPPDAVARRAAPAGGGRLKCPPFAPDIVAEKADGDRTTTVPSSNAVPC